VTDFLVPVLIGAAAALLPFIGNWYWQRRRDSIAGFETSLGEVVQGWLRRARGSAPEVDFVTAPPEAFDMAASARTMTAADPNAGSTSAAADAPRRSAGRAAAGPTPRTADPPGPVIAGGMSGGSTPPPVGAGDSRSPALPPVNAIQEPAAKRSTRPRTARGRTTIQLDPLDVPVDSRRARITVGALIDDLERAKLGRPT
jgi:hypothetical protein